MPNAKVEVEELDVVGVSGTATCTSSLLVCIVVFTLWFSIMAGLRCFEKGKQDNCCCQCFRTRRSLNTHQIYTPTKWSILAHLGALRPYYCTIKSEYYDMRALVATLTIAWMLALCTAEAHPPTTDSIGDETEARIAAGR